MADKIWRPLGSILRCAAPGIFFTDGESPEAGWEIFRLVENMGVNSIGEVRWRFRKVAGTRYAQVPIGTEYTLTLSAHWRQVVSADEDDPNGR